MSASKLVSVGYVIPGDYEHITLDSDTSLLDADIILVQPEIPELYYEYGSDDYKGKPTLGQTGSFQAAQQAKHWRAEIATAVESGKTVIVFLAKPEEVYVFTGHQEYSGTGRNQKVTNIVALLSSYDIVPATLGALIPRQGREIRMASNVGPLAAYWAEFRTASPYQLYFEKPPGTPVLLTKTGEKAVGVIVRLGKGHLVLIPPVQYDEDAFTEVRSKADGASEKENGDDEEGDSDGASQQENDDEAGEYWTEKGMAFGARLVAALLRLDQELRGEGGRTPPPDWSAASEFRLSKELDLEAELSDVRNRMTELRAESEALAARLAAEGGLRRLLYESGAELEAAILDALRLLGYRAENFREGESEFDAVFVSPEGTRYIGEAEGKENKAVNIDKLSQLERNIQEDFARDLLAVPQEDPARDPLQRQVPQLADHRDPHRDLWHSATHVPGPARRRMAGPGRERPDRRPGPGVLPRQVAPAQLHRVHPHPPAAQRRHRAGPLERLPRAPRQPGLPDRQPAAGLRREDGNVRR